MKVIVLGSGVIGTMTAWYLLKAGHQVTVIDRQPAAALETSFANGGIVCPSLSEPWAAPGAFGELLRSLGHEDAPLLLRLRALPHMWRWGLRFVRECAPARFRRNTERNLRLAAFSAAALREVRAETRVAYDETTRGGLKLFSDPIALDHAVNGAEMLRQHGLSCQALDRAGCVKAEPALSAGSAQLAGGIFYPGDESGDCHKFTQAIAALAADRGATFLYSTTIRGLILKNRAVTGVETDRGALAADAIVVALGSYTPMLLRPLGLRVPIYPVKGYTITVPAAPWPEAPTLPILDEARKFGMARFGDRLRAAGSAEITGYDTAYSERRAGAILKSAGELFPDFKRCLAPETARPWCGLRPFTPDGPPILGPTRYPGLFINAGHGHLGWTLSCGSGKATADIVSGREPPIDLDGLTLSRFAP